MIYAVMRLVESSFFHSIKFLEVMAAGKTAKGAGLDCACTHKGVAAPHRWNVGGCLLIWTERLADFLKCFAAN